MNKNLSDDGGGRFSDINSTSSVEQTSFNHKITNRLSNIVGHDNVQFGLNLD